MKFFLKSNLLILVFSLLIFSGCLSSTLPNNQEMELTQNARVTIGANEPVEMKRGDKFTAENKLSLVEAPGHMSMLIVPMAANAGPAKISLKPITSAQNSLSSNGLNADALNEVLAGVSEAQSRLALGRAKDALVIVESLQAKYQGLTYLNFLKASCYVVAGENSKAKTLLERTLKEFPDNKQGQELFLRLKENAAINIPIQDLVR